MNSETRISKNPGVKRFEDNGHLGTLLSVGLWGSLETLRFLYKRHPKTTRYERTGRIISVTIIFDGENTLHGP